MLKLVVMVLVVVVSWVEVVKVVDEVVAEVVSGGAAVVSQAHGTSVH